MAFFSSGAMMRGVGVRRIVSFFYTAFFQRGNTLVEHIFLACILSKMEFEGSSFDGMVEPSSFM